ncbi:MAG: hypothetical protein DRO00_04855 [Thermoproteota archaeon]|nr:MAG: hypothetical protein DRO00_04855 [Candidatus Korarchaeota archaeon]
MFSRLLPNRASKPHYAGKGNCIKIIKREILLEKIRRFAGQSSNFEFLFVGLVEGGVDSLSLPEKFAIWQKIGEIIDEARRMGLRVLKHGITGDGRIFLVLAK